MSERCRDGDFVPALYEILCHSGYVRGRARLLRPVVGRRDENALTYRAHLVRRTRSSPEMCTQGRVAEGLTAVMVRRSVEEMGRRYRDSGRQTEQGG